MMTPDEHYAKAEQILEDTGTKDFSELIAGLNVHDAQLMISSRLARAQVHATLSLREPR